MSTTDQPAPATSDAPPQRYTAQLAAELAAEQGDQRALAGADRAGHAEPQSAGRRREQGQGLREYCS